MCVVPPRPRALDQLTASLFDYAGLYPPAALSVPEAVAEYLRLLNSPDAHFAGPFVVDVARLATVAKTFAAFSADTLRVSLIAGAKNTIQADLTEANDSLPASGEPTTRIVQLETLWGSDAVSIEDVAGACADSGLRIQRMFFEVQPMRTDLSEIAELVRSFNAAGGTPSAAFKIRCGGATLADIPEIPAVARFLKVCRRCGASFKATAGLHHPVRLYQPELGGFMHGFLNILVAAAVVAAEPDILEHVIEAILAETDANAFRFTNTGVHWRRHEISCHDIARLRSTFAYSIGSCSIAEPAEELAALLSHQHHD